MEAAFSRSLPAAGNFANLLPTGTVLIFETLIPSFSNGGSCTDKPANKLLTISLISLCAVACFFCSFTDSFVGENGRIYYGIATTNGLYILNDYPDDGYDPESGLTCSKKGRYKLCFVDFVHAFVTVIVFLALAVESSDFRKCLLPKEDDGDDWGGIMVILIRFSGVMVGTVASFLLAIFPTKRRGIGFTNIVN